MLWPAIALTGCVLCFLGSVWLCQRAMQYSLDAEREIARVLTLKGRVIALETSVESLDLKHRKLSGRVYATAAPRPVDEIDVDVDDDPRENAPVCGNFLAAQHEGPLSAAARCECAYCASMRAERGRLRERHVPKTAQAAAARAKVTAGKQ